MVWFGFTNCCRTDAVRLLRLRCRAIFSRCRLPIDSTSLRMLFGDVNVSRFPREKLKRLILSSPNLQRLLIEFATREMHTAQNQLSLLGNGSAEEKVAIFLVNWRNRLTRSRTNSQPVPLPMRRQDIADFLGLKLETVSRTLAKLEEKDVIRLLPKGVLLTGLERASLVTGRSY